SSRGVSSAETGCPTRTTRRRGKLQALREVAIARLSGVSRLNGATPACASVSIVEERTTSVNRRSECVGLEPSGTLRVGFPASRPGERPMPVRNLRDFLDLLRREGDLVEVAAPVDPRLEIAEIHRRVIAAGGPALLFTKPGDSPFPVVTNMFGSAKRIELAFGPRPERFVRDVVHMVET